MYIYLILKDYLLFGSIYADTESRNYIKWWTGTGMNTKFRFLFLFVALTAFSGTTFAALILDITDAGSSQTRWQFSGSDTILSGNSSTRNGYWFDENNTTGFNTIVGASCISAVSGTFSGTTNGISRSLSDICVETGRIGIRVSPTPIGFATGSELSWIGDLVMNVSITNFAVGVFTGTTIGTSSDFQTMTQGFEFRVGQSRPDPDPVPVPATLALFGLGLAGLGWSRRKKA
ncbi:MAG: PEP-CTERM sorting domain-containing protein [Haliea sp.]